MNSMILATNLNPNSNGIMQVTGASGYKKHAPYTANKNGYDNAILDGCNYLNSFYHSPNNLVYSVEHYNAESNALSRNLLPDMKLLPGS